MTPGMYPKVCSDQGWISKLAKMNLDLSYQKLCPWPEGP